MKQRTRKIIVAFLSLVMMLTMLSAMAFAAESDHYVKEGDLEEGKYVIAVQKGNDWYALTAEAGSKRDTAISKATKITVEDDEITGSVANTLVWTSTAITDGYRLTSYENGYLYLSVSQNIKYQDDGYRALNFYNDNLYNYTGTSSLSASITDAYVCIKFADDNTFTTAYAKGDLDAAITAANTKIVLFKYYDETEYAEYKAAKEAAELGEQKTAAIGIINGTKCDQKIKDDFIAKVNAAKDKTELDTVLADFDKAVQAEKDQQDLADAVSKATDKINAAKIDDATKAKYLEDLKNAKSVSEVNELLAKLAKEPEASGSGNGSGNQSQGTVPEEQKKATDEINKVAADTSKYDADEQKAIKDLANQYIIKINATTNVNEIKNLVNAFNAEIKALPTKADKAAIAKIQIKMKKIKVGKKKMTVKWTPKKANFDGYEISYQIKGKKKAKKVTVKKATASKKVIKKLKKGKKYKVKVRGYKLFGTKKDIKVYGKWSKTKTSKKIK